MSVEDFAEATSAWSVSLSPDGVFLAYVSDRDGSPRLFVCRLDGNQETVVDTGPDPVQEAHWSFDGEWLALSIAPGGRPRTEVWIVRPDGRDLRRIAGSAELASYLGPWTHQPGVLAFAQTTKPTEGITALYDIETGVTRPIARGGEPLVLDLDAGNNLALIRRGPRGVRSVWAVDLRTGREREIRWSDELGSNDLGRLSPDAKRVYVRSNAGRDLFALFSISLDEDGSARPELVAERPDAELEDLILTADGRMAALLWNRAGRSECELLDLPHGSPRELLLPEPVAHGGAFSKDGRLLALTLEGPTHPRAVHVLDIEQGTWRRFTSQPAGWTPPITTPTLERFRADDGLELSGWLYRASGASGRTPAAVLHFHGGPEAQERPGYNPLFQALSAHGIAVFAPNIRGSSGFGRSFVNADNHEKRWQAIADVAACARYLLSKGLATESTLACAGRSYGGYLTLAALVFHPQLFAAGVDVCGMSDLATFYRDTEPWIAASAFPKYGHPEADAALLRELSPIHHFGRLRAPLLVVHGENDSNVPWSESKQAVDRAREVGVPVEFLSFPDEGHTLLQRQNRERFIRVTVSWLGQRLFGQASVPLLANEDPAPFRVGQGTPGSPFFLTCDHAGRRLPICLGTLGLEASDVERHIGWDIGAAGLAERLAESLKSFLILQTYSRLVIDCNRPLDAKSSIAEVSEATVIPGNQGVSAAEAKRRADAIFHPYHQRIEQELEQRRRASLATIYVAVHSFTPRFMELDRPFHVGVLYGRDARFGRVVLELLRKEGRFVVGDNEPYSVSELSDYGVIQHAERRGLLYVELEIRQDLLADAAGQAEWAEILSPVLRQAAERCLEAAATAPGAAPSQTGYRST